MPPRQWSGRRGGEDALMIIGSISSLAAGLAYLKYRVSYLSNYFMLCFIHTVVHVVVK
jgi:hypothetical protein